MSTCSHTHSWRYGLKKHEHRQNVVAHHVRVCVGGGDAFFLKTLGSFSYSVFLSYSRTVSL